MPGLPKLTSVVLALLVVWSIVASVASVYAFMRLSGVRGKLATSTSHLSACRSVNDNNRSELDELQSDITVLTSQLRLVAQSADRDQQLARQQQSARVTRLAQSQQALSVALSTQACAGSSLPAAVAERLRTAADHARRAGARPTGGELETGAGASHLSVGGADSASDLWPVRDDR